MTNRETFVAAVSALAIAADLREQRETAGFPIAEAALVAPDDWLAWIANDPHALAEEARALVRWHYGRGEGPSYRREDWRQEMAP